jgi:glutamyl-tRNA synthetase
VTESITRPVRVRFAPSPTGSLHIGGLRTALFNWLFARHFGGQFILRIEDTDQTRFDPTALQTLTEALRWAGLNWDEGPEVEGSFGPYVQSERLVIYQQWAKWLVDHDKAYHAYETSEELDRMRKEQEARKLPPGYNRQHRYLSAAERAQFEAEGRSYVVRLKMPLDDKTHCEDQVQGKVIFDNENLRDTVLLKADGFPTYHLAHVVDDHLMQISHVMRAVEWLPSLPIHWQLWDAFGWERPIYMHLPVMLTPNGRGKISKRNPPKDSQGNVIPVMVHDYIRGGYLPEAVVNFLANTGWSYGDDIEIFSIDKAIQRFDGSRIIAVNAAFPVDKLKWINAEYIRKLNTDDLAERLRQPLLDAGLTVDEAVLRQVAPHVQTRIKTLNEVVALAGFLFKAEFTQAAPELIIQKKMDAAQTAEALRRSAEVIASVGEFTTQALHDAVQSLTTDLGLSNSQLFGVLRVAITGQTISPPTFETMEILGKSVTVNRLQMAQIAVEALMGTTETASADT